MRKFTAVLSSVVVAVVLAIVPATQANAAPTRTAACAACWIGVGL